jgi:hypothetical protein
MLSCNGDVRVRLTDVRDHSVQELDLQPETRDMAGWQSGVMGWSIGPKGSGARIELDERLDGCKVGVFAATHQALLWGLAKEIPEVWIFPLGTMGPLARIPDTLVPFEAKRWFRIDREELGRVAFGGGDVRIRFDQSPIRFGNYIFESLKPPETTQEYCAFCSEPLHRYFRVGSQQACPDCTETFRREKRLSLALNYRRALGVGTVAAIVGGSIHGVLLASAGVSLGSIFVGLLVGIAVRWASRESAGTGYRVTAVLLTLGAGSLEWWPRSVLFGSEFGETAWMSTVYLVVGLMAAWIVSARNVQTEVHGPFQSKTV